MIYLEVSKLYGLLKGMLTISVEYDLVIIQNSARAGGRRAQSWKVAGRNNHVVL